MILFRLRCRRGGKLSRCHPTAGAQKIWTDKLPISPRWHGQINEWISERIDCLAVHDEFALIYSMTMIVVGQYKNGGIMKLRSWRSELETVQRRKKKSPAIYSGEVIVPKSNGDRSYKSMVHGEWEKRCQPRCWMGMGRRMRLWIFIVLIYQYNRKSSWGGNLLMISRCRSKEEAKLMAGWPILNSSYHIFHRRRCK